MEPLPWYKYVVTAENMSHFASKLGMAALAAGTALFSVFPDDPWAKVVGAVLLALGGSGLAVNTNTLDKLP